MIEKTKITLSAKELEMVCNADWILTKQVIIQKVRQLFGNLSETMQQQMHLKLPENISSKPPKISRGECYQNLPYVILDYPRYFTKEETTAIRTFFWWGNFCSITLHLSGRSKVVAMPKLVDQFLFLQQNEFSICVGNTPWEHHFWVDNFVPVTAISLSEFTSILKEKSFVKIAKKIPLHQWDQIFMFLQKSFSELEQFIPVRPQACKTNLLPGIPTNDSDL